MTLRLVTFGISHFCEKARWALDWHRLAYSEISWPPGVHIVLARRCGAKRSSLPILVDDTRVIEGSGAIIDWADHHASDVTRRLTLRNSEEIELRADKEIGIQVRRLAYAEMLPKYPHLAKPGLFRNVSMTHRVLGEVMWPVTRRLMIRGYELHSNAAAEARAKLQVELDWLDNMLADRRPYLAGDAFSRADVTVASLLAPFARPAKMQTFHSMSLPSSLIADVERWRERPIMRWVISQYDAHRFPSLNG